MIEEITSENQEKIKAFIKSVGEECHKVAEKIFIGSGTINEILFKMSQFMGYFFYSVLNSVCLNVHMNADALADIKKEVVRFLNDDFTLSMHKILLDEKTGEYKNDTKQ